MTDLITAVRDLLRMVPEKWRGRVYATIAVIAGIATIAVLVLPFLPALGVELPPRWVAVLTGIAAFFGALAKANTPAVSASNSVSVTLQLDDNMSGRLSKAAQAAKELDAALTRDDGDDGEAGVTAKSGPA